MKATSILSALAAAPSILLQVVGSPLPTTKEPSTTPNALEARAVVFFYEMDSDQILCKIPFPSVRPGRAALGNVSTGDCWAIFNTLLGRKGYWSAADYGPHGYATILSQGSCNIGVRRLSDGDTAWVGNIDLAMPLQQALQTYASGSSMPGVVGDTDCDDKDGNGGQGLIEWAIYQTNP
ncbi:hypothetical protein QBC46DRAFT_424270 [Diplogelasinospora grovesii]|uniref:Ecp2 effector protein-like domain-containing protein n=1 Tax=Diplogelasinospora grovesii TaxID=303347 RepID=A0AAN6MWZ4_9PEZI|nr:hypothetical protein QBC46DRAFT_424270 [Diplogelasinospora grovesii]